MEHELLTLPVHLSSHSVFSGFRVCCSMFSFLYNVCRSLFVLLAIVLSVLQFTASDVRRLMTSNIF